MIIYLPLRLILFESSVEKFLFARFPNLTVEGFTIAGSLLYGHANVTMRGLGLGHIFIATSVAVTLRFGGTFAVDF